MDLLHSFCENVFKISDCFASSSQSEESEGLLDKYSGTHVKQSLGRTTLSVKKSPEVNMNMKGPYLENNKNRASKRM